MGFNFPYTGPREIISVKHGRSSEPNEILWQFLAFILLQEKIQQLLSAEPNALPKHLASETVSQR